MGGPSNWGREMMVVGSEKKIPNKPIKRNETSSPKSAEKEKNAELWTLISNKDTYTQIRN